MSDLVRLYTSGGSLAGLLCPGTGRALLGDVSYVPEKPRRQCPYCARHGTRWPLVSHEDGAGLLVVDVYGEELVCNVLVTDAEIEMEDYVLTARISYCPVCGRDLREVER